MQTAIKSGWITDEEVPEIRRQIEISSLPRDQGDSNPILNLVMKVSNLVRCEHLDRVEKIFSELPTHGGSETIH